MRLTCPNCGAQYEVPDEVIPEIGRDVQCSNCGDTWFQNHPDHTPEPEEVEEAGWDAPPEAEEDTSPETEVEPEPEEESELEPEDAPEQAPEQDEEQDEAEAEDSADVEQDAQDTPPSRRELEPSITEVLREEAERERAARASDGGDGLETQPELGLNEGQDDTDKRTQEAQARMARLRGEPESAMPDDGDDDGPYPGTRRNLLPDIDEINSSLNSDSSDPGMIHPSDVDDMANADKPGGFRRGFLTMVLLAVIGLLLYMFAPQLAEAVPALKGVLASYVEMVNGARAWLDQTIGGLMGTLDGMSSEGS